MVYFCDRDLSYLPYDRPVRIKEWKALKAVLCLPGRAPTSIRHTETASRQKTYGKWIFMGCKRILTQLFMDVNAV
jgi:hypothetical protein